MTYSTIRHDLDDGVLTVTLDRPEQLNSFTPLMADELERTFREVNDDDAVRAVIVTGAGKAFCAGMDLTKEGNVFGLDESMDPSLADMQQLDDPALIAGVRDPRVKVMPAHGLSLQEVSYPPDELLAERAGQARARREL